MVTIATTAGHLGREIAIETFPVAGAFTISRSSQTDVTVVRLTLAVGSARGSGECRPYARYGENAQSTAAVIADALDKLGATGTRDDLARLLPAGAARNAIDCALWDLEARLKGIPVWRLAGLSPPEPVMTAYTISWADPAEMAAQSARHATRPLLKIKLGQGDMSVSLSAIRAAAPRCRLIVDANEAWDEATLAANLAACRTHGVELVEQPVPAGRDALLAGIRREVALCADESVHDTASLAALAGLYDAVNIKLDKTGGLTEALAMRTQATAAGLKVMVGCMLGTSLAMAPAMLLAQGADWVDLDAPLLLAADRAHAIRYGGSLAYPPAPQLWGGPELTRDERPCHLPAPSSS